MDTGWRAHEKNALPRAIPHASCLSCASCLPCASCQPIALPAVGDKQNWGTSPNLNMPCALPSTCPQQGEILDALINFVNNLGNILPLS